MGRRVNTHTVLLCIDKLSSTGIRTSKRLPGKPNILTYFSQDDKLEGIQEPGQNEDQRLGTAQSGKKDAQHKNQYTKCLFFQTLGHHLLKGRAVLFNFSL